MLTHCYCMGQNRYSPFVSLTEGPWPISHAGVAQWICMTHSMVALTARPDVTDRIHSWHFIHSHATPPPSTSLSSSKSLILSNISKLFLTDVISCLLTGHWFSQNTNTQNKCMAWLQHYFIWYSANTHTHTHTSTSIHTHTHKHKHTHTHTWRV